MMNSVRSALSMIGMLLAFQAAPAVAQQSTVSVSISEQVTITVDPAGVTLVSRSPADAASAEFTQLEQDVAAGNYGPSSGSNYAQTPLPAEVTATPIEPNTLRFTFMPSGEHATILLIRSGYDRALSYRAVLHRGLQSSPSDVCMVRPHGFGVEQWPYRIDSIDLSELTLVPFNDGDQ